jgi:hypothetical protein
MESRVARAKELLATVRHAAMATVNEDGSSETNMTVGFTALSVEERCKH